MTMTDPTALTVVDDETPGALEPVAPVAAVAEPPHEPAEPAEPLVARLDRLPSWAVTAELRAEAERVDALIELARAVEVARRDAEQAVTDALAHHEAIAAIEAEIDFLAAEKVAGRIALAVLDPVIVATAAQRVVGIAQTRLPNPPALSRYAREVAAHKRLTRESGGAIVSPPPTTMADERALTLRLEAEQALADLTAGVEVVADAASRPGADVVSTIAAAVSLVERCGAVAERVARANEAAADADELRRREGITWRTPTGEPWAL